MSRRDTKGKGLVSDAKKKRSHSATDPLHTSLATCTVHPTRFIDWETMARLGVKDDMEMLFANMGLQQYMHLMERTHADETLQFLGSLVPLLARDAGIYTGMQFEIHGETYRLRLRDLCEIYGFQRFGLREDEMEDDLGMMDLWHHTSNGVYQLGKAKASNIRSPVIKLIQRSLGFAFLGRLLVGPVTTEEWRLTCFGLRPLISELQPPIRAIPTCDPAIHFIANLRATQEMARGKKNTGWPLCIGGALTPIFRHCGVQLSDPITTIPLIDMAHLRNCHFLTRAEAPTYPFTWNGRHQELRLPRLDLVSISDPANIRFAHILDGEARDEGVGAHPAHDDHGTAPARDETQEDVTRERGTTSRQEPLHYTRRTPTDRRLAKENTMLKSWVKTLAATVKALKGRMRSMERHTGHTSRTYIAETRTKSRHDRAVPDEPDIPPLDIATPPSTDSEDTASEDE